MRCVDVLTEKFPTLVSRDWDTKLLLTGLRKRTTAINRLVKVVQSENRVIIASGDRYIIVSGSEGCLDLVTHREVRNNVPPREIITTVVAFLALHF